MTLFSFRLLPVRSELQHLTAAVTKVRLLLSIKTQATLTEPSWCGLPRPLPSPRGGREHAREAEAESESSCVCARKGLGALASDWVFREQRGVQKAPQWSNRISSLWWMVCESSTDSSLSQIHTSEEACMNVCVRGPNTFNSSPTGSRTFRPLRAAGTRKEKWQNARSGNLYVSVSLIDVKSLKHVRRSGIDSGWPIRHAKTRRLYTLSHFTQTKDEAGETALSLFSVSGWVKATSNRAWCRNTKSDNARRTRNNRHSRADARAESRMHKSSI